MTEKSDGGPAFPRSVPDEWTSGQIGMSYRRYLAAKAMEALIINPTYGVDINYSLSCRAWLLADSMIEMENA